MAFHRCEYPASWPAIRTRILARAGDRCEGSPAYPDCRAENHQPHPVTGSRVVLTIAHWPDSTPLNADPSNLHAWCNRCHLTMDRPHHIRKRRETVRRRRERLQPALFTDGVDEKGYGSD